MDHPLDELSADGTFRHSVPVPMVQRIILVAAGLFVLGVSTWELWRGVWPFNFASPFFAALLIGAYSVGFPVTIAGLFGPAAIWAVRPGSIEITLRNPFGTQVRRLSRDAIVSFDFREHQWDSRANTWSVVVKTVSGESFETRDFGSLERATALKDQIETLFRR